MKKFAAFFCALCIAALSASTAIYATGVTHNVHLQNPVSVCYDGSTVYVADGEGDVHIFFDDGLKTVNFNAPIFKIRASGGKIFAQSQNSVFVYDGNAASQIPAQEIKDFEISDTKMYALFADGIREIALANLQNTDLKDQGGIISVSANTGKIAANGDDIYYMTDGGVFLMQGRYTHNLNLNKATAIFYGCDMLFKFDGNSLEFGTTENVDGRTVVYKKLGGQTFDFAVADAFAADGKVFVINGDKLTAISYDLAQSDDAYTIAPDGKVYGSNVKNYSTDYQAIDSFERIEVCKTSKRTFVYAAENGDETQSWCGYLEEGSLVFKLSSFDGFAYVLYRNGDGNDGFGFINQNDLTQVPHSATYQNKVTITSNENIFALPLYKEEFKLKQDGEVIKIANTQSITVLAEINELDGGIWVFAEVDGTRGFMLKDRLKNPPIVYPTYEVFVANPAIGQSLAVYSDLNLNDIIAKLKSGTQVKVFDTYGGQSKILLDIDGQNVYGWVETARLIGEGGMTDTVAFGLAIGIIILLAVGFVVVWKIIKNKKIK